MSRIKVLFCGDTLSSPTQTGFGYVATSLMNRFDFDKYELGYCTIIGQDSLEKDFCIHGEEFPKNFSGKLKLFNSQISGDSCKNFNDIIKTFKPRIVITISDPWNVDHIAYCSTRHNFLWVHYLTVETPDYNEVVMSPSAIVTNIRKSFKDLLGRCDLIIPVTKLGYEFIERLGLKHLLSEDNVFNGIDISLKQSNVRKNVAFKGAVKETDYVFMTMGKNSARKRIDLAIESFYKFLEIIKKNSGDIDKYKLYCHTNPNEPAGGTDLLAMVNILKIPQKIIFPKELSVNMSFSKEELYKRYSASDCYIALPGGEGMGLGFIEAMLHEKPIIHTTWGGHNTYLSKAGGIPVKTSEFMTAANFYMKWAIADTNDVALKMYELATGKIDKKKITKLYYNFVKEELDWDKAIFPKFISYVENAYKKFSENELSTFGLQRVI